MNEFKKVELSKDLIVHPIIDHIKRVSREIHKQDKNLTQIQADLVAASLIAQAIMQIGAEIQKEADMQPAVYELPEGRPH